MGGPIVVLDGRHRRSTIPAGNPQRLVGVIVASGGSVTIDQASEALWGDDDVERSRTRLRNVLLRLRRAVGDLVVRTGSGLRLAPGVACDLLRLPAPGRTTPLATARADPELAGELAAVAVGDGDDPVFVDFEYDEWAVAARRQVDQQRIGLLDLLSVQAEDAGDLPAAQALAERALRLDRYTDSRYVRLAELLTMQDRVAAAMAVLDDAAAVAREVGDGAGRSRQAPSRRAAAPRSVGEPDPTRIRPRSEARGPAASTAGACSMTTRTAATGTTRMARETRRCERVFTALILLCSASYSRPMALTGRRAHRSDTAPEAPCRPCQ